MISLRLNRLRVECCHLDRRAMERCRAAISCSTSLAVRHCLRHPDLRDGYLRADPGHPAAGHELRAEGPGSGGHLRQAAVH